MDLLQACLLQQGPPGGQDAVPDIIMYPQLHGKGLFLPDNLRHLFKKRPKPLVRLFQLCVFLFQLVLLLHQSRHVSGGNLRIPDACFCGDQFFPKAQHPTVRKTVDLKLGVQAANGCRRRLKGMLQLRKGLDPIFPQVAHNGKHPVVDQPHHAVFIEEADPNGKLIEALLNSVHSLLPTSRFFQLLREVLQAILVLLPLKAGKLLC